MNDRFLAGVTLVLAFLGIADSWYLASSAITGTPLVCGIQNLDGCNVVAQSQYSHLFGIPLGIYGVGFYALAFIVAAYLVWRGSGRHMKSLLVMFGTIGLVASIIFEVIQVFLIKAICIYCLGSAILSLFIFIIALILWRRSRTLTSTIPVLS